MKKISFSTILVSGIIVVLAGAVVVLLIFMKNQPEPYRGVAPMVEVNALEPDSAVWGQNFPNQFTTLLQTSENNTATVYGGSFLRDKLVDDPRLVGLFAGYPFSKEYNEDRGHEFALVDVEGSARVNEKTPGTCYSCKSSDNPALWASMGMAAYPAAVP